MEKKIEAIKAYKSQFFDPASKEPQTYISDPDFFSFIESRAREIIARLIESARSRYVPSYLIAVIEIGLNDADAAFTWLERAFAELAAWLLPRRASLCPAAHG